LRKKATIYFNDLDEYLTEEQAIAERFAAGCLDLYEAAEDIDCDEVTFLLSEAKKRYYPLEVNFGDEELDKKGTTKITKTIFEGTTDKTENAIVFLNNLEKAMKNPEDAQHKPLFDDERIT